jgi:hypothetical protein
MTPASSDRRNTTVRWGPRDAMFNTFRTGRPVALEL